MNAFVTGARGFIGAHLVRELAEAGHEVRAAVRPGSGAPRETRSNVATVEVDLDDRDALRAALHGSDTVFHLAGTFAYTGVRDDELIASGVRTAVDVVDAAASAGCTRVVLTSSSVTLGSSPKTLVRDETMHAGDDEPGPAYFRAKRVQERAAFARAAMHGIPLVVACPTVTVGSGDRKLLPSNAIVARYVRDPYRISFPGGCNIVSVRDVARGHVAIAERGIPGERYVLGSENLEWSLIHRIVSELCGLPGPSFTGNATTAYLLACADLAVSAITGEQPSVSLDEVETVGRFYWYSHARAAALGYRPVPAREALADAVLGVVERHLEPRLAGSLRLADEVRALRRTRTP